MYDKNNVFAKIISGEIPVKKIYEDNILIAILDINPAAPTHILVIPKKSYIDFEDFVNNANLSDVSHYFKKVAEIAKENKVPNYRIISNIGREAGQSVFHFHTHILSGMSNLELINK